MPLLLAALVALSVGSTAAALSVKESKEKRYGAHMDAQGWVHFSVFAPAAPFGVPSHMGGFNSDYTFTAIPMS